MSFDDPDPKSPSWYVVGGVLGLALLAFFWLVLEPAWAAAASLLLAYEAWTFGNRYRNDTLSEVVWVLVRRPLVPFILGAGSVALIAHGIVRPSVQGLYVALAYGVLMGHFVFQRKGN